MPPRKKACSFIFLASPHRIVGEHGAVKAIEVTKTRLGAFDTSGRRRPIDTGEVHVGAVQRGHHWRSAKASTSEFCRVDRPRHQVATACSRSIATT